MRPQKESQSMNKPFWETSYLNDDISTFGIEPNVTIIDFLSCYRKDWDILDVGCGEGKNDLYLAKQGVESHLNFTDQSHAFFFR